jgi:SAM-dependent methyltransferase
VSEGFFGERVAAHYDELAGTAPDAVIDRLHELAGDGAALEFAIGTGRIAVPLAERGVSVVGVDDSEAMLKRLRAKTDAIEAVVGDMATTRINGEFSLVYLVFNTIFNLTTQDAQIACFANAARHLRPRGRFVIETGVPALQSLPLGQTVLPFRADPEGFSFDVYDVVTQNFSSQHFYIADSELEAHPVEFRYAWPSELDLMARLAGMQLEHRWAGWEREPFTHLSPSHVSVYLKTS